MARRRISEEPVTWLAVYARRFALFALAVSTLDVLIMRVDLLEIIPALATLAGAMMFALVAILLALAALVVIWREGVDGLGSALTAIAIGLGLVAYPGYLGVKAYSLPAINDITTDPADPPRFEVLARIRPREGANPIAYPTRFADKQRAAYPDIEPVQLDATPRAAYDAAYRIISRRKWQVVEARPPEAGRRDGHIEAVARTPIMGFRDDVALRIRADGDGTRLDMRSASRYGLHDFGTNATRVTALLDDIEGALDADTPARPVRPAEPEKPDKRTQPTRPRKR